ncbi:MAG: 3'-5' exonuclease [Candidatus Kerfeldbacteria bacterium]|nr:3'-5' exonuclease [Candidatus Kerfeldbacteria bacterium]
METQLIVLDVETTGFRPDEGHEIVELAAQKIYRDKVLEEFQALLRPSRSMDPEVVAIHGITDEMLAVEGKPASEILPLFVTFCGTNTLVGHNIAFDLGFINAHLARLGLPALTNPTMDTIEIAKRLLIIPSYSLEKVAQYLKVPQPEAHRALADVNTTRQVLLKLFERVKT